MQRAFSLIELSIVLVILGLLTGGILAGQSLIRASELRAASTEYNRYFTGVQSFRDKYFSLPGDMSNATSFWGKDATNCNGNPGSAGTPGTCNGDGNGLIAGASAINATGEMFQFWKQLALAGLIEGSYTGLAGPTTPSAGYDTIPGTNAPASRLTSAAWAVRNLAVWSSASTVMYDYDYGQVFIFAGIAPGNPLGSYVMKPEEAWNLDTKIDDGKPAAGKIIAMGWTACTTSSSKTDYTGSYRLSDSALDCGLYFLKQF